MIDLTAASLTELKSHASELNIDVETVKTYGKLSTKAAWLTAIENKVAIAEELDVFTNVERVNDWLTEGDNQNGDETAETITLSAFYPDNQNSRALDSELFVESLSESTNVENASEYDETPFELYLETLSAFSGDIAATPLAEDDRTREGDETPTLFEFHGFFYYINGREFPGYSFTICNFEDELGEDIGLFSFQDARRSAEVVIDGLIDTYYNTPSEGYNSGTAIDLGVTPCNPLMVAVLLLAAVILAVMGMRSLLVLLWRSPKLQSLYRWIQLQVNSRQRLARI